MAKKASLSGKIIPLKDFQNKLEKKLFKNRPAQKLLREAITPIVAETINKAIADSKSHFRPYDVGGSRLVGELGVGSDGKPDKEKLNKAWEIMQFVGNLGSSVSTLKLSLAKGRKFATFEFNIRKSNFYDHFRTNYISMSGGKTVKVPWMKNFLIGIPTIEGYGFVEPGSRKFKPDSSRTGLGHMIKVKIPSKQYKLLGYGEDKAFGAIIQNANKRLTSARFAEQLKKAISRALRRLRRIK